MGGAQGKELGLAPDEKEYLAKDGVDQKLKDAILKVAKEKPDDALARIAQLIKPPDARGLGQVYQNVTQTIGNTPCVKISDKMCPPGVDLYVKCEFFNPLSSVKDRLALAVVEDAERSGRLKPGDTLVEATSGNTGIAVAMVAAQRGYRCVITSAPRHPATTTTSTHDAARPCAGWRSRSRSSGAS